MISDYGDYDVTCDTDDNALPLPVKTPHYQTMPYDSDVSGAFLALTTAICTCLRHHQTLSGVRWRYSYPTRGIR